MCSCPSRTTSTSTCKPSWTPSSTLQGDTGAVALELDALKAQVAAGQPVGLTGLDGAVATLKARVAAVGALVPPPAPPAPPAPTA